MATGFTVALLVVIGLTGLIALMDFCWWRSSRDTVLSKVALWCRGLFPLLLLVFLLRSFIVQPYRVPTGSLEPTILPGDFVMVSQFDYGLHLPLTHQTLFKTGAPQRGDIALFRWPVNPAITYVKRIIGIPGDHISYRAKQLIINGKRCPRQFIGQAVDMEPSGGFVVDRYREECPGVKHDIFVNPYAGHNGDFDFTVPAGQYFVMGDNRDNSNDSRTWGAVSAASLIGKARYIWLSWDAQSHRIVWDRIGRKLQ